MYSNPKPKPVPSRPINDFNVDLIQLHIARIFSLLEDLNEVKEAYLYLVSWKNPALTSLSLIIFVTLCLRFNTEYFGRFVQKYHPFLYIMNSSQSHYFFPAVFYSLPTSFIAIYMMFLSSRRSKGYRAYLQRKERDASLKVNTNSSIIILYPSKMDNIKLTSIFTSYCNQRK